MLRGRTHVHRPGARVTAPVDGGTGLRYASPRGRWVLAAAVLGSGLAGLDATVVGIALPAIGRDFGVGVDGLQWVITAYTLTLAGLLLLGGALGARYGRRGGFSAGGVSSSAAPSGSAWRPHCAASRPAPQPSSSRAPCRASARRCSPPAAWRCCRRRSPRRTARGRSAHGRGSAGWPPLSAPSSAAG